MSAHSPGPWEYDGDSYIVSPKADVAVASLLAIPSPLFTVKGAWDQEQALANARLIAAAPELLEALRALLADGSKTDQAQAAIRKAVGS